MNGNAIPHTTASEQPDLDCPRVSASCVLVAIPTLNEVENIRDCLESLLSNPWTKDARVVVADGGSTDGTRAKVTALMDVYPNLEWLDNSKRLQSAAINAVASQSARPETRILVRCDAHATYPQSFVRQVVEALDARPNAASLVVPMDAKGRGCFGRAAAWVVDTPLGSGGAAHRGGQTSGWVDHGHHAGFRLDWFNRIGGYDETFSHNEDAEFDHRLAQAGGRVWLEASIRLDYRMRSNPQSLARQYWNYGRGRARTVTKHRLRPRLRQIIPALNVAVLGACLVLAPVLPVLLLLPFAYLCVVVATSLVGVAKLRSPCGLWAGPAIAIMHNTWGAGFLRQCLSEARR